MSESEETFYTADRWQNWLDRVAEEDLDPENEDSARLLLNLQDDTAIAIAKILAAYDDDRLSEQEATDEIADIRDIVLEDVDIADEEKAMLIDGVQTSQVCVFYAAEEYVVGGAADEGTVAEYVEAAAAAEAEEDVDAALGYLVQAGTRIIDGDELPLDLVEDLEYGFVSEWVNGLDSLQSAMADPEVVEEDE
ncbi:DUF2150 family protein [Halobaculum halobium]|uniref:DUF2150 family protein n=1 Tax=Halobaculum halobium TaxID=3032281 RepID=A0ABD5T794_9EURY|nr:DUF2150 family protein [Halobaculum sp. SYNS20]